MERKSKIKISKTTFWDKRDNLINKPSLSLRTIEVVQHIMIEEEIALGLALEKLMLTPDLYKKTIEKLKIDYPDIKWKRYILYFYTLFIKMNNFPWENLAQKIPYFLYFLTFYNNLFQKMNKLRKINNL